MVVVVVVAVAVVVVVAAVVVAVGLQSFCHSLAPPPINSAPLYLQAWWAVLQNSPNLMNALASENLNSVISRRGDM